jgi:hypothetical protein
VSGRLRFSPTRRPTLSAGAGRPTRLLLDARQLLKLAALLGFVLGQWFAVVHATRHELSANDSPVCQVCAIAHAAGGVPAVAVLPLKLVPQCAPPAAPRISVPCLRPHRRPPSRAPPQFLV